MRTIYNVGNRIMNTYVYHTPSGYVMDLCQYFGHKKLNIFSLHDINT
jgi:hypothetical protein